ncbi:hypothetical protein UFOVP543_53, partial [uncultured Caudovirales phage]
MKTVDTFIYVGGSLGLVGGHHNNPRLSFVRLSDYLELDAKVKRMAMDSLHDINHIAELQAEVERLKEGNDCLGQMHDKEMERSAYLLEEFNRTTAWGRGLESDLSHARVEISFLKAE